MAADPFDTEPETDSDGQLDFETITQSLGEPRRELLTAFLESDRSVLSSAQLREHTEVPSGSVTHHLERLNRWGLVEEQEKRQYHGRGGSRARTWGLTERGNTYCAEHLDVPVSAFVSPEEIAELDQRMREVEDDIETIKRVMVKIGVEAGGVRKETAEEWFAED